MGTWNECAFCSCWVECSINTALTMLLEFYILIDLCLVVLLVIRYLNLCLSRRWEMLLYCGLDLHFPELYSKTEDQIKYFPSSQIVPFKTCWDFTDYSNLLIFLLISVFLFLFSHMKWTLPMPLNRAARNMFLDRCPCMSPSSRVPQAIIHTLRS